MSIGCMNHLNLSEVCQFMYIDMHVQPDWFGSNHSLNNLRNACIVY